jgi:hypothetical protein
MLQHIGNTLLDFSLDVQFVTCRAFAHAPGKNAKEPPAIRWRLLLIAISIHRVWSVVGSISSDAEQIPLSMSGCE